MKHNMFVGAVPAGIVDEVAGSTVRLISGLYDHPSGHAEMGKQDRPVIEFADEIFRPAAQFFEGAALQAVDEIFRDRNAQVISPHLDAFNPAAFHDLGQATANGFDFRKLGHIQKVAGCARARYPQTHGIEQ